MLLRRRPDTTSPSLEQEGLPRLCARRRRRRQLALLVAALAVLFTTVLVTERFRELGDRHRRAQLELSRFDAAVREIAVVEARSWTAGDASPLLLRDGLVAWSEARSALDRLASLELEVVDQEGLRADADRLHAAGVRSMRRSLAGDRAEAMRIARDEVRPGIDDLETDVQRRSAAADRSANRALTFAEAAFIGSLSGGLLLALGLLWRFERLAREARLHARSLELERRSDQRLRALVEHSSDVVLLVDDDLRVLWQAESLRRVLGRALAEGQRFTELVVPADLNEVRRRLQAALHEGRQDVISARMTHADGGWRTMEVVVTDRRGDPDVGGILLNLRDISDRRALEQELCQLALHDVLTGLANRQLFEDRLDYGLRQAARTGGALAVLFLDLDDFKTVNDGLGHAAGDELLRAVAGRISGTLRTVDTAARLGGDEFAVLLPDVVGYDDAEMVADRLVRSLGTPFELPGRQLRVSASVGIATNGHATSADELLRNADAAMYAAKAAGKHQVCRFDPSMHADALQRLDLIADLRGAVDDDALQLHYQPIVDLDGGRTAGFEALVRWEHPQHGRLAPAAFIPLAEETGLIVPLGRWVLRTACEQLRELCTASLADSDTYVSVNVSPLQLEEPGFADDVRQALSDSGLDARQLVLEITEALLVGDPEALAGELQTLRDLGVRIAIDDFGTGHSALAYLRLLPVELLKIDRAFIDGIEHDPDKAAIVSTIVELARTLRLQTVAEGVETPEQAEALRAMQSSLGQGYHFSRPLPLSALVDHLRAARPV